MEINRSLLKEIEATYCVKPEFAALFLRQFFNGGDVPRLDKLDDIQGMPEPTPMYFNFAMSTNLRGRDIAKLLLPYARKPDKGIFHLQTRRQRYLDVGCAYGGFLVAFAEQGFDVAGIEINPDYACYGDVNCKEHGLENKVITGDFLSIDTSAMGKFDLITCNDVIEHVKNPELTLHKLASLLNPGGVLFMEIPNRHCIRFVEKDGHFSRFGITLLQRSAADVYLRDIAGSTNYLTEMGEYYDLEYYLNTLSASGMKCELLQRHLAGSFDDMPAMLSSLSNEFLNYYRNYIGKADYFTHELLVNNYLEYLGRLAHDYRSARISGDRNGFTRKYLLSFWSLVAVKGDH